MTTKLKQRLLVAALIAALAGPTLADEVEPLWPRQQNGIRYVSGGIGLDEVASIVAAAPGYSTMLGFAAASSGEYVSDVRVVIREPGGKAIFQTVTEGPFLLVNLPPGQYQVLVTYGGVEQAKQIKVAAKGHVQARFYWIVSES